MTIAGKSGNYCTKCFGALPEEEKKNVSKIAKKLHFWAKHGYYFLILLIGITIVSLSLTLLNPWFFLVGFFFLFIDFLYGYRLFKFLSNA